VFGDFRFLSVLNSLAAPSFPAAAIQQDRRRLPQVRRLYRGPERDGPHPLWDYPAPVRVASTPSLDEKVAGDPRSERDCEAGARRRRLSGTAGEDAVRGVPRAEPKSMRRKPASETEVCLARGRPKRLFILRPVERGAVSSIEQLSRCAPRRNRGRRSPTSEPSPSDSPRKTLQ
jgi:hypothetical protein